MIIKPITDEVCDQCGQRIFAQELINQNNGTYHIECANRCDGCHQTKSILIFCSQCDACQCESCYEGQYCPICEEDQCPECSCELGTCDDCGEIIHTDSLEPGDDDRYRCYDCHRQYITDLEREEEEAREAELAEQERLEKEKNDNQA